MNDIDNGRVIITLGKWGCIWRLPDGFVSAIDRRSEDTYAGHEDLAEAVRRLAGVVRERVRVP